MATYTENLGLIKPDKEDFVDINVINNNYDTIDEAISSGGGGSVKSFTYDPFTSNTIVPLEFPSDCHYVLRVTSKDANGDGRSWNGGFSTRPDSYGLMGVIDYRGDDASVLWYAKAKVYDNNTFEIRASNNDWHLPYRDGDSLTIYYI